MKEITAQTTLEEIGMYGRLRLCLLRANIKTVGELVSLISADPWNWGIAIPNFSEQSKLQIYSLLISWGILKASFDA